MGRAPLLALLVVLGLPLGAAGAESPTNAAISPVMGIESRADSTVQPVLEEVPILSVDGGRTDFGSASADVGTVLAVQRRQATGRLDRYPLEERFEDTSTEEAKQTLLFEEATDVEIRLASLRTDERQLRADYANRTIDTGTYLARLAVIDARAAILRNRMAAIRGHADEIPQFSMEGRLQLLEATLYGLEGPVRDRTYAALAGEATAIRVYARGSPEGLVLSTIEGDRFVREAYHGMNRDTDTIGSTSFDGAIDLFATSYAPFAFNETLTLSTNFGGPIAGVYVLTFEFQSGSVTTYLDGSTQSVFFEIQERQIDQLELPAAATGEANGTHLVVNRSYPGGPMRLVVIDADTEEPVNATIHLANTALVTGADGVVWTLAPPAPTEVTAVRPAGNVTISVRPLAPTTVGDREN